MGRHDRIPPRLEELEGLPQKYLDLYLDKARPRTGAMEPAPTLLTPIHYLGGNSTELMWLFDGHEEDTRMTEDAPKEAPEAPQASELPSALTELGVAVKKVLLAALIDLLK